MVTAGIANTNLTCSRTELVQIQLPSTGYSTCTEYLAPYIATAGGKLLHGAPSEPCLYCPVTETNVLLKTLGIDVQNGWRDFGVLTAYVVFNVAATFILYRLVRISKS